jgi:21S rRNA (GM2251-2'-O)-methyltransferase
MATIRTTLPRLFARHFSQTGYRKPYNANKIKSNASIQSAGTWDYVYGLSSVASALSTKRRSVLDTVYIQESDEKKTTQKKDASLIAEILQLSKSANIRTIAVDKGNLNNWTDNKPHQVSILHYND